MTATATRRKRKPKLPPGQRYRILESREGIRLHGELRHEMLRELRRRRKRMENDTPSSTWLDAAWERGDPWPTGWVRCNQCGHLYPKNYITMAGACQDCRYAAMRISEMIALPPSPSGLAIQAILMYGIKPRF